MRIPIVSHALFNTRMKTIEEIRRERLTILRNEAGGVGMLAAKLDRSSSQVSQWLNASAHSQTKKERGMSEEICRYIEEKCEKERGWMDSDPDKIDAEIAMNLMSMFLRATEQGQRQILAAATVAEKLQR